MLYGAGRKSPWSKWLWPATSSGRIIVSHARGAQAFGIAVDAAANAAAVGGGAEADVSAAAARSGPGPAPRVLVIPTNEELSIAEQTLATVSAAAA